MGSRRLRGILVLFLALVLEALLVSCTTTFVLFSVIDRAPVLQWGRVGGVITDWLVDIPVVLPLLAAGALFNGVFAWILLTGGDERNQAA